MNKTRIKIRNNLLSLGKKASGLHISKLFNDNLHENCINTSLVNFDYSKQRINREILDYLFEIPDLLNIRRSLEHLFEGEVKNVSEDRYVSHSLYREKVSKNEFKLIAIERERFRSFLDKIREDKSYKNLICLSIGGSRLGPELLYEFQSLDNLINVNFCSSLDYLELKDVLRNCKQKETLIFTSSKSFQTTEVMKNLDYAKAWLEADPNVEVERHLFGISANSPAMTSHGIIQKNQFVILESLVGRFSIWSSVSLPAFVNSNFDSYLSFLEGGNLADRHTVSNPWEDNISVVMALLSIWNSNSLHINNHAIFTYNFRLRSFTKYIAQLSMESNGKTVNFESEISPFASSPLIWGGYGIESQHSIFQWLFQAKTESSCDFIGVNDGKNESKDSYKTVLSQVVAVTQGEDNNIDLYKSVRGNNPSSVLTLNSLDLKSLGYLIALYENKTFIESLILGIDPFDQWGVQLGKKLSLNSRDNNQFLAKYFSADFLPKS